MLSISHGRAARSFTVWKVIRSQTTDLVFALPQMLRAPIALRKAHCRQVLRVPARGYAEGVYKQYSKTLQLPQTTLKNRPDRKETARSIERTGTELYKWQRENLDPQTERVFHDGPPYANGDLHLGHALNKVLKDIVNRYNIVRGRRVHYVPGWDCHGLPIELASLARARKKHGSKVDYYSIEKRRGMARSLALEMIDKQKAAFRQFCVMADWDGQVYRTLTNDYVVRQLRVFERMMQRGLISRQERPVYWSAESETALAESELQYGTKISQTVTVKFPVVKPDGESPLQQVFDKYKTVNLAIWTTTPWTLPANRAISVNPDLEYTVVELDGEAVFCLPQLASEIKNSDGTPGRIDPSVRIKGSDLAGNEYTCLLRDGDVRYPILSADYVTDTSGTGLVHNAPGHGMEDYLVGQQHGIAPYSPIDDKGRYTAAVPESLSMLAGLDARTDGQAKIIERLRQTGALIWQDTIEHSVPFDWRSKTPVMVRATPQFFADVGHIRGDALSALDKVQFVPETGRARLSAFTNSRTEWCISRQRVWGVPIPVVYDRRTGDVCMEPDVVSGIIAHIDEVGVDRWFAAQDDVSEWLPAGWDGTQYRKGIETMDVWFDSGTSWTMLEDRGASQPRAHYYLEGSDQHRGWFQSSLLTKVAISDDHAAPYERVITHGFTLDDKGQKMSKSLGNIVTPLELINGKGDRPGIGIDGMRVWIAQADYTSDIALSDTIVTQVAGLVKKLRFTYKFLLGNLSGYDGNPVPYDDLSPIDKRALADLYAVVHDTTQAYDELTFSRAVKSLQAHMNGRLSAFYFDIAKDALYADASAGATRRGIQTVLAHVFRSYAQLWAPVTPLMSQEVWDHAPAYITNGVDSPFKAGWIDLPTEWNNQEIIADFNVIEDVKKCITEVIDQARQNKDVRSSLACEVAISCTGHTLNILKKYEQYLADTFVVSVVHLNHSGPTVDAEWSYKDTATVDSTSVEISVLPPSLHKCPRCWKFTAKAEEALCNRCDDVLHHH